MVGLCGDFRFDIILILTNVCPVKFMYAFDSVFCVLKENKGDSSALPRDSIFYDCWPNWKGNKQFFGKFNLKCELINLLDDSAWFLQYLDKVIIS